MVAISDVAVVIQLVTVVAMSVVAVVIQLVIWLQYQMWQ